MEEETKGYGWDGWKVVIKEIACSSLNLVVTSVVNVGLEKVRLEIGKLIQKWVQHSSQEIMKTYTKAEVDREEQPDMDPNNMNQAGCGTTPVWARNGEWRMVADADTWMEEENIIRL